MPILGSIFLVHSLCFRGEAEKTIAPVPLAQFLERVVGRKGLDGFLMFFPTIRHI